VSQSGLDPATDLEHRRGQRQLGGEDLAGGLRDVIGGDPRRSHELRGSSRPGQGLISGFVTYRPDPVEPPAAGNLLICCSQPQGDIALNL